jgi:hypothetical protein
VKPYYTDSFVTLYQGDCIEERIGSDTRRDDCERARVLLPGQLP